MAVNTALREGEEKALKGMMLLVACHVRGADDSMPVAALNSSWTSPSAMEPNIVMQRDGLA